MKTAMNKQLVELILFLILYYSYLTSKLVHGNPCNDVVPSNFSVPPWYEVPDELINTEFDPANQLNETYSYNWLYNILALFHLTPANDKSTTTTTTTLAPSTTMWYIPDEIALWQPNHGDGYNLEWVVEALANAKKSTATLEKATTLPPTTVKKATTMPPTTLKIATTTLHLTTLKSTMGVTTLKTTSKVDSSTTQNPSTTTSNATVTIVNVQTNSSDVGNVTAIVDKRNNTESSNDTSTTTTTVSTTTTSGGSTTTTTSSEISGSGDESMTTTTTSSSDVSSSGDESTSTTTTTSAILDDDETSVDVESESESESLSTTSTTATDAGVEDDGEESSTTTSTSTTTTSTTTTSTTTTSDLIHELVDDLLSIGHLPPDPFGPFDGSGSGSGDHFFRKSNDGAIIDDYYSDYADGVSQEPNPRTYDDSDYDYYNEDSTKSQIATTTTTTAAATVTTTTLPTQTVQTNGPQILVTSKQKMSSSPIDKDGSLVIVLLSLSLSSLL